MTKFHENSTKIVDFSLMAMFGPCPIFYASPSILYAILILTQYMKWSNFTIHSFTKFELSGYSRQRQCESKFSFFKYGVTYMLRFYKRGTANHEIGNKNVSEGVLVMKRMPDMFQKIHYKLKILYQYYLIKPKQSLIIRHNSPPNF